MHDIAEPLTGAKVRRRPVVIGRDRYVLGAIAVARELAQGVFSEAVAGRAGNAIRLARHLFEQELELDYVLADPGPRLPQVRASDAARRLRLSKVLGTSMPRDLRSELKQLTRAAQSAEEDAVRRRKEGELVPASDYGYLPDRRVMSQASDREADYDLYYGGASWLAHPGIIASELYLTDDGLALKPPGRPAANDIAQGVALALGSLYRLIEKTNWILGPYPGLATLLAAIVEEVERVDDDPAGSTG